MPLDSSMMDSEDDPILGKNDKQSMLAFDEAPDRVKWLDDGNEESVDESGGEEVEEELGGEEVEEELGEEKDSEDVDSKEDDDSADDSEDDEQAGGLEFSWTKIPSQNSVNVSQLVSEEIQSESSDIFARNISPKSPFLFGKRELGQLKQTEQGAGYDSTAQLVFSEPLVESENQNIDLNDSQFAFGEPHDESMDMEAMDVEADHENIVQNIEKPVELLATPVEVKTETSLRRSTRKGSRDEDSLAKAETLPHHVTPLKGLNKNAKKTPAKRSSEKTPLKVSALEFNSKIVEEKTESTPKTAGRPKRGTSVTLSKASTEP
jgi:hypothetical protein